MDLYTSIIKLIIIRPLSNTIVHKYLQSFDIKLNFSCAKNIRISKYNYKGVKLKFCILILVMLKQIYSMLSDSFATNN